MLVALAHGHGGKKQNLAGFGKSCRDLCDNAGIDRGIDRKRKMRTMLLGGTYGQNGDDAAVVEPRELFARMVRPIALHLVSPRLTSVSNISEQMVKLFVVFSAGTVSPSHDAGTLHHSGC